MCISPGRKMIFLKDATGCSERRPVDFNCGKCFQCLNNKVKEWQVRLLLEQKTVKHSYFITLTYAGENVPVIIKDDILVCMTLSKRHLQLWLKKLRKKHSVRFFAIGEYGGDVLGYHNKILISCIIPGTNKAENISLPTDVKKHLEAGDFVLCLYYLL